MTEQASSTASAPEPVATSQDTPEATQSSQETTKEPQKFKTKDGQEVTLERLLHAHEALGASTKRYQEASSMRKNIDNLFQGLSKKDKNALTQLLGVVGEDNFRELAENYLIEKLEYESLSDSEKEHHKTKKERDAFEQKLKEKEEKEQESIRFQLRQKATDDIDKEVAEYLQSSKIKTPRLVARALETIQASLKKGDRIPLKDAWKIAEDDIKEDVKAYLKDLPVEDRKALFTKEEWKSLRDAEVEAVRSGFHNQRTSQTPNGENSRKQKNRTLDDWLAEKERKYGR